MAVDNPSNLMPDQEIIIEGDAGFVPKASPSDAGKVLGVLNSSGDVGWVVDQSGTFIQVQADWAETDSSQPSYIDHKPDLSVYATASGVETALAGKQDTISDLSEIRAGAAKGDTAVQPSTLESYATTSAMNTALAGKQDTISDLATIRSGASAGATAVQPSALDSYATTSAMNTALAGKQDTISDLSTIRSGAEAGATAVQPSQLPSSDELVPSASSGDAGKVLTVDNQGNPGWVTPSAGTVYTAGDGVDITSDVISADVDGTTIGIDSTTKKIKSLQTIPTKTSDLQNDSNFVVASSLATVATSGSYADLSNKPSIPAAQVNSDWNASSGVSQILNKPSLATVATTGDYSDLSNKPSIPAAQVNADWNANTGVAEILNKPSLATVATTGAYSDLSGKPTIPSVDQTYNASSTNAQSGTAVAGAIASIPSSSYTAGDGIDITSNEISVNADDTTLDFKPVTNPQISTSSSWDGDGAVAATSDVIDALGSQTPIEVKIHLPSAAVFYNNAIPSGATFRIAAISRGNYIYAYEGAVVETYVSGSGYMITEQDITVVGPATSWAISGGSGSWSGVAGFQVVVVNGTSIVGTFEEAWGGTVTYTVMQPDPDKTLLTVKNPLPASAQADSGKVLKINASGNAEWGTDGFTTTAGITDIQQVAALPANPVATVLYLIPET